MRLARFVATGVKLSGDWMGPQPLVPLVKGEDGVWIVTVGPLEPNIDTYGFLIDNVRAADPSCRCTLASADRFACSKFVITGPAPNAWDERDVPKGALHQESHFSKQQSRWRKFTAYTPPGYRDTSSRKYPVLLLLSGTPGNENDWTTGGGFAHTIFDNLLADGKMAPMIVVMHASDVLPSGTRAAHLKEFEPITVNELVPAIMQRYQVERQPRRWAIAGLSLGGEFAMTVGLRHPELFRTVVSISGSLIERDFEDRFGAALARPEEIRKSYRLIWIGSGSSDLFTPGAKSLSAKLTSAGVANIYVETPGAHTMPVFRHELIDLLPRLFR